MLQNLSNVVAQQSQNRLKLISTTITLPDGTARTILGLSIYTATTVTQPIDNTMNAITQIQNALTPASNTEVTITRCK